MSLELRLRQYIIYLCFSSHLQAINKVYEQCSANWHSINYSIETILPYYVIQKFVVYKQIIIGYCPAVYLISKNKNKVAYTLPVFFKEVSSAQKKLHLFDPKYSKTETF